MNAFDIVLDVTKDVFRNFTYFIKSNLLTFANVLNFIMPYTMYFVGQYVISGKVDKFVIGYEALIPLAFIVLMYYLKSIANKIGKGMTLPMPDKRFTQVDEDGEVSVEHKRLQELLLYVADLEDWMERKGML